MIRLKYERMAVCTSTVQQYSTDGSEENEVVVRHSRIATWDVCRGCDIGGKKRCGTWDGVKAGDRLGGKR